MRNKTKWWIFVLVSLAIIVGLSGLQHFIYEWAPNPFFATFAPISESAWEHLKIVFYPFVFVWIVGYFFVRKKLNTGLKEMLFAAATGATSACFFVLFLFYLIHSGLGVVQGSLVDIGIEVVSLFAAQILAWHLARRSNSVNPIVSIAILFAWIVLFIVFSFAVPNAPMFVE